MTSKLCVLAVVALVAFGLKRHYAEAAADDLRWMLGPTSHVVRVMTGVPFIPVRGEGYFSRERLFLIEKSCAGINFMIAAFGMVAFVLLRRVRSIQSGTAVLVVSLLASYAAAVIVNAARISIAIWLAEHRLRLSWLSAADVHRLEGVTVYFGGLVLLYALVRRVDRGTMRGARAALPLAAYYAVTLGLPLANGAAQTGRAFATHALVVLLVPLLLLSVAFLAAGALGVRQD